MSVTVATGTIPQLPVDDLAKTLTYDGDFIATMSVVYGGVTYTKTYTNDGDFITAISGWRAQP